MAIGKRQTLDWLAAAELNRTDCGQPGLRWVHVMINNPLNRQKTRIDLQVPGPTLYFPFRTSTCRHQEACTALAMSVDRTQACPGDISLDFIKTLNMSVLSVDIHGEIVLH